jgi:hypothetical protein
VEISRWCKPPVTHTKCREPREGRRNCVARFPTPPLGLGFNLRDEPVVAPPANFQCPFGTTEPAPSTRTDHAEPFKEGNNSVTSFHLSRPAEYVFK